MKVVSLIPSATEMFELSALKTDFLLVHSEIFGTPTDTEAVRVPTNLLRFK